MIDFVEKFGVMFMASFAATTIATLPIARAAYYLGIVDHPGLHKTHSKITPLLGGLAIFLGIAVTMLHFSTLSGRLLTIFIGALILLLTGLLDDVYSLKPLLKLGGQTAAAAVVVLYNIDSFSLFAGYFRALQMPGWISLIFVIGWIVLMINAFNLIDGLDGLAAGTAAIIFAAMAAINFLIWGSTNMLILQVIAVGACVGFLFFNFHPARIFMGDTGSMLLGFLLTTTYLFSLQGSYAGAVVLGSLFIFSYPALDVTFAILRRIRRHTSILKADKGHIHHVMISLGFSVRETVLIIYVVSLVFSLMAIALLILNVGSYLLIVIGVITFIGTLALYRFFQLVSIRNGLYLSEEENEFNL